LGISQRFYGSQSQSESIDESATASESIDLRF
jgi:hypothetical protein